MAITDFSVNKLRFWAVVAGVEVELTRVELHYALNTIPDAQLYCAIGRDVRTLVAAAIHFVIEELRINLPITVWCEAFEAANSGVSGGEFPPGPFIVFDGRVVGIGYQKSRTGGATLKLYCRHFLMDLEYALTNTFQTHPKNMGAGNQPAGIKVAPGTPSYVIQSTARKHFTKQHITGDLWGAAVQPWLDQVLQVPPVFFGENVSEGQGVIDALVALDRIEGNGGYQFGVPLPLVNFDVLRFDSAVQAIAHAAAGMTFKSFTGTTIWEKISQDFGAKFMFAIAPMANRALVIPFIPGLRKTWATIDPSEYDAISLETELPRVLRGVIVYTGLGSQTGAFGFQRGQADAIRTVGGIYQNIGVASGMFIFHEAPLWLGNAASAAWWGMPACGADRVKGNALDPGVGDPPRDNVQPRAVRFAAKTMWDAYAHSIYLYEVLKMRRGALSGRMRFDICPGSSVEVILTEEKFVGQQVSSAEQSLFGMVTKVTIVYDSDAVQGQTNIEFAYLRDFVENDTALGTDAHPLYRTTFPGAPLVEEQPT